MSKDRKSYQREYRAAYKGQAKRVNLTLSNAEYKAFLKAAQKEGLKPTAHIKQLALAGLGNQVHLPRELNEELKALRFAVLNIANNVNQIAHHANTVKHLTQSEEHNLLAYLKQLDEVVRSYTTGQILSKQKTDDH